MLLQRELHPLQRFFGCSAAAEVQRIGAGLHVAKARGKVCLPLVLVIADVDFATEVKAQSLQKTAGFRGGDFAFAVEHGGRCVVGHLRCAAWGRGTVCNSNT